MELLSSLTVFAVLIGTIAPTVARNGTPYALRGASRQLFADLQQARLAAVNENTRYTVFLINSHTYQVLSGRNDTNNNGTIDPGEPVTTGDMQNDWRGVTITGSSSITFLTDGTALAAGSVTLSDGNRTKLVTVSQAGAIKIS